MKKIEKRIIRETEKAMLVVLNDGSIEFEAWLPKSQITVSEKAIEVPEWLLKAKIADRTRSAFTDAINGKYLGNGQFYTASELRARGR